MVVGFSQKQSCLRQATAIASAALILILGILASSPDLHAWLHGHEHGAVPSHGSDRGHSHPFAPDGLDDDDGCAVTLFAQGVVAALAVILLAFEATTLDEVIFFGHGETLRSRPVFEHARALAPPCSKDS